MIPDLSNDEAMAKAGRLHVLRSARHKAAAQLRDKMAAILNHIDSDYSTEGVHELIDTIEAINLKIKEIQ